MKIGMNLELSEDFVRGLLIIGFLVVFFGAPFLYGFLSNQYDVPQDISQKYAILVCKKAGWPGAILEKTYIRCGPDGICILSIDFSCTDGNFMTRYPFSIYAGHIKPSTWDCIAQYWIPGTSGNLIISQEDCNRLKRIMGGGANGQDNSP